jgi:hypothetical protein
MGIASEVRPYMAAWISLLGALGLLTVAAWLVAWLWRTGLPDDRQRKLTAATLVLAIAFATPVALTAFPARRESQYPLAAEMADAVARELHRLNSVRSQVKITPGDAEPGEVFFGAAAILLQLDKRRLAFAVDRDWWNFFGDRWRPTGAEDTVLEFYLQGSAQEPPPLICRPSADRHLCVRLTARRK